MQFIDSLPEEPVSEDLEEYAKKLAKGAALDKHNLIWMCKKGAEWQKQKDEELFSKDTWTYIEENYPNITEEEKLRLYDISIKSRLAGAETFKKHMKETLQTEYEKGLFDMREEMMKDAVDAFVNTYENSDDSNYVEFVTEQSPYKFKETEKCKIIIVKDD
jgi:predicted metal-dependent hydrolase